MLKVKNDAKKTFEVDYGLGHISVWTYTGHRLESEKCAYCHEKIEGEDAEYYSNPNAKEHVRRHFLVHSQKDSDKRRAALKVSIKHA